MSTTQLRTPDDLAETLRISPRQVIRRAATGEFPHLRLGRAFRFTDDHVAQIIATHEVTAASKPEDPWGRVTNRRSA